MRSHFQASVIDPAATVTGKLFRLTIPIELPRRRVWAFYDIGGTLNTTFPEGSETWINFLYRGETTLTIPAWLRTGNTSYIGLAPSGVAILNGSLTRNINPGAMMLKVAAFAEYLSIPPIDYSVEADTVEMLTTGNGPTTAFLGVLSYT